MSLPNQSIVSYNQKKFGIYGELGEGANAKIRFLQTVIKWDELDKIKLISNIKGSETWDVRDLFQRDVDTERVSNDLIPYLEDTTKIKYFSPITLILLPMAEDRRDIIKEISFTKPKEYTNVSDGNIELEIENPGFHKFSIYKYASPIAEISWNDSRCNLVAVDGQHRLSALKNWESKPNTNFSDWKIPVVILTIFQVNENQKPPKLLEIVRRLFVYINSKAQTINKSRELLLNDESVNAICAQEIISKVHQNDNAEIKTRDSQLPPLLMFDWQGKVINHQRVVAPASIFNVEELVSWFREYFLGTDGSDRQKHSLDLLDLVPPLEGYDEDKVLTYSDSQRIRERINNIILPGFFHFLKSFEPFKKYISECRDLEKELTRNDQTGIVQHAFFKLRFGTHNGTDGQIDLINDKYNDLNIRFKKLREDGFDSLLITDLGLRSVMYSFSKSKNMYQDLTQSSISWLEFSKRYTKAMNSIYATGLFKKYDDLPKNIQSILEHLCYDAGTINSNYKLENVKDGLGSMLILCFFVEQYKQGDITDDQYEEIWGDISDILFKTYQKGGKKKIRSSESDSWRGGIKAFNQHIKEQAEKYANKKIEKLSKYLQQ